MLSVITVSVFMLGVVLNDFMVGVIVLSVIMLNVVVPFKVQYGECFI